MDAPPKTVVCASAMGYYGDTGEEVADEDAPPGDSFVAEVCRAWEAAAAPLREKGIRVAFMRLGMVLSPRGGALATMLPAFRAGAGSRLGDGRQWTSWIALDDVVGGVHHLLARDDLEGPFNFVAPGPVRNADFTRVLAGVLRRPALGPPVPAVAMRAVFGEMADELLLNSARLEPRRLREGGYDFAYPELAGALRHLLGRTSADER
jgi:hypothetical protein